MHQLLGLVEPASIVTISTVQPVRKMKQIEVPHLVLTLFCSPLLPLLPSRLGLPAEPRLYKQAWLNRTAHTIHKPWRYVMTSLIPLEKRKPTTPGHLGSEFWDMPRPSGKMEVTLKVKAEARLYLFHIFVSGPIDLAVLRFFL